MRWPCSTRSPWTSSMSTSEYRAVAGEGDLPISAAELAALANQLYAASVRPGFDSPPQSAPVAPRGNVLDTTAGASAGQTAAGAAGSYPPPGPPGGARAHLGPGADVSQPRPPAANRAARPAWQRSRHHGCAVDRGNDRQHR